MRYFGQFSDLDHFTANIAALEYLINLRSSMLFKIMLSIILGDSAKKNPSISA